MKDRDNYSNIYFSSIDDSDGISHMVLLANLDQAD